MRRFALASVVLAATFAQPASADDEARLAQARKEWATATLKLGLGLTQAAIAGSKTGFPPSDQPVSAQKQALITVLAGYQRARAEAQGHSQAMRAVSDFAVNGTVAVMAATGVGAVPAAVVKASGQMAADMWVGKFESELQAGVDAMLAKQKGQLLNVAGVSYEQLQGMPAAEIKAKLEQSTTVFADMQQLMASNPNGIEMAKDLLVQGVVNTQRATLEQLQLNVEELATVEMNLGGLANAFVAFRDDTAERLDLHATAIGELQGAVGELQVSMTSVEARLRVQERDGAVVADFVFAQMDPRTKATALQAGFLGERFECTGGATDCEQAQIKADLIARFEAEAKVQERVAALGRTVQGLADVSKLAANLGIDVPGLGEAAGIGNVAFTAFSQYASGNVLGAITTASSVFAKRTDPDQARFEAMMKYLRQELEQINQKLKKILENQQKLMDAVVALSEQVARQYRALDERLARMEFELDRVSETVRTDMWKDLRTCFVVHNEVQNRRQELGIDAFGNFPSIASIRKITGSKAGEIKQCKLNASAAVGSLAAANYFGNFLDANLAVNFSPETTPTVPGGEEYHTKKELQWYIA